MIRHAHPEAAASPEAPTSDHLRRLLRDDETLLWSAKPHRIGWYTGHFLGVPLALGVVGLLFGAPFAGIAYLGEGGLGIPPAALAAYAVAALAALGLLAGLASLFTYRRAELALTDDRVLKAGGLVGVDTSTISLADVQDVEVQVSLMDKLWGTGALRFQVAGATGSGLGLWYVADPHAALERIEEARRDARGA